MHHKYLCPKCEQSMIRTRTMAFYCPTCKKTHETYYCKKCYHIVVIMKCDICRRPLEHDGDGHWHCPRGHKPETKQ